MFAMAEITTSGGLTDGALAGGGVAALILGLLVWLVKVLVSAALRNMEANTEAIKAQSEATNALVGEFRQQAIVRDERDRSFSRALDRIERHAARAAGAKSEEGNGT